MIYIMTISISNFIARASIVFPDLLNKQPWEITDDLESIVRGMIEKCDSDYTISDGIAIHKTAKIEQNVVLKAPVLIGENVTVGANAYIRGAVVLDENVHIGAGSEIKQSAIFSGTAVAHFNYIGNSIIGSNVNFEAGSVAANHYNEREDKIISVMHGGEMIKTGVKKFGSLVGDDCRIGANAVLSPGTILPQKFIVKRLELIEQVKER
jgi:UDP-N-acetylglucosamine diphosphorylase / glucose-1-phosphate thymidylyltransferase / UDP-N-acetylgalactosamine diphosphorylase / glucosamine-1-phosphate N-acetyltransferase / galactosamine-1-phosphate N-acetyltransferase